MKTYDPSSGRVAVRGIDGTRWSAVDLRRSVGYVPQVIQLFSRSVADNVRISAPDATEAQVWEALRAAHADEFVRALPHHAGTVLEEAGAGLSGGERRRIGLARALLKDVDLYILDEVTSDLDSLTEAKVMDGLFDRSGHGTLVLISHRLAAVTACDRIYVLDDGRIVEQGTHEELRAAGGVYTAMWEAQHATHRAWGHVRRGRRESREPVVMEAVDSIEMRYGGEIPVSAPEV